MQYYLGLDIGSVSLNIVILNENLDVHDYKYIRLLGNPLHVVKKELTELFKKNTPENFIGVACTGIGGQDIARHMGGNFVPEITSQFHASVFFYHNVRSIIEIGGEDAKFITLTPDERSTLQVKDVQFNSACAAGTGSFLDQQASRFHLSIEDFAQKALLSEHPPRIAGRCSVFAKSDMIHLQQIATPQHDIIAGLHFALARNFKATLINTIEYQKPIIFQGGLASNPAMIKAFRSVLELRDSDFIVHKYNEVSGAIGAVLESIKSGNIQFQNKDIDSIFESIENDKKIKRKYINKKLCDKQVEKSQERVAIFSKSDTYFLGIDIGSVSTNLVVINQKGDILTKHYLPTASNPIAAVQNGLQKIHKDYEPLTISGVGTTGSGRYLISDLFGGDYVRNEITAQATAAIFINPKVDTIFEIGGQDSKYISIQDSAIIDFEMNKACAAGTGSFLEEQAEKMGMNIRKEFEQFAFKSEEPAPLGDKCTVFIESDLVHQLKLGTKKEDLCAGLSYSIVNNYINRVVNKKKIGECIFFQGGTANNKAVVEAFRNITGKHVEVPPYNDVTGAWGIALLVKEAYENEQFETKFKGFQIAKAEFITDNFICKDCDNHCEIKTVRQGQCIHSQKLFYGDRCGKFEIGGKKKKNSLPNAFTFREKSLRKFITRQKGDFRGTVGIPLMLNNFELIPLWVPFFNKLGYKVKISEKSNTLTVQNGINNTLVDMCFPVKLAYGHIHTLIKDKELDYIFLPNIKSLPYHFGCESFNHVCPWSQTIKSSFPFEKHEYNIEILAPALELGASKCVEELSFSLFAQEFCITKERCLEALYHAKEEFANWKKSLLDEGKRIRDTYKDKLFFVLLGRSYNTCDRILNLDIPKKLLDMDIIGLPMDMVPTPQQAERAKSQYWRSTKHILNIQKYVNTQDNLYSLYISNFMCGPDSFNHHYFCELTKSSPALLLEIDEHSADAGIITRIEAYVDSIYSRKKRQGTKEKKTYDFSGNRLINKKEMKGKKFLIPYMNDASYAAVGVLESEGYEAEVLSPGSLEGLSWGRKYCSGKECYPCQITTGEFIRSLRNGNHDPEKTVIYMPGGSGPCRFGEYNHLQKRLLKSAGFGNVLIMAPNQDDGNLTASFFQSKKAGIKFWEGISSLDYLQKALHQTRPYEKEKGKAQSIYDIYVKEIYKACKNHSSMLDVMKRAAKDFKNIEVYKENRPIIGVVGEIFVRFNPFSNENLIFQIEELGGEAWLAPFSEWVHYLGYLALRNFRQNREYKNYLTQQIENFYLHRLENKLGKPWKGFLRYHHDTAIAKVVKMAENFISDDYEGETVLSIGKSIDYLHKGASAIVNAAPFGCMPGTLAANLLKKMPYHGYDAPTLSLSYEGSGETQNRMRLEALMFQAKQYNEIPKSKRTFRVLKKSSKKTKTDKVKQGTIEKSA